MGERFDVRLTRARVVAGRSRMVGASLARGESLGAPVLEIVLALRAGDAEIVAGEAPAELEPAVAETVAEDAPAVVPEGVEVVAEVVAEVEAESVGKRRRR